MRGWLVLLAMGLVLAWPGVVYGHAWFEWSDPAPDAVLRQSPRWVSVWVTSQAEPTSWITVTNEAGEKVDQDPSAVVGTDGRMLTVRLRPNLPDGLYTVVWYAVANDDLHETGGNHLFRVDRAGAFPATPPAQRPQRALESLLITGGVLMLTLAVGAWIGRRWSRPD